MRGESRTGNCLSSLTKAPADKQTQEPAYPPQKTSPARSKTFSTSLRVILHVKNFLVITPAQAPLFFQFFFYKRHGSHFFKFKECLRVWMRIKLWWKIEHGGSQSNLRTWKEWEIEKVKTVMTLPLCARDPNERFILEPIRYWEEP